MQYTSNIRNINNMIQNEARSRAWQCANAIRTEWTKQLSGQRTGREYTVPGTSVTYTASAPGEPPARRAGDLAKSVNVKVEEKAGIAEGQTGTEKPQALRLEKGFVGVDALGRRYNQAPRPSLAPAKEKALPEIKKILERRWF